MAGTITLGGQTLASHDITSNTITLENVDTATIGSNALVVDSNGRVGIGTSSPQKKLDVISGEITASNTEADSTMKQMRFGPRHYTNGEKPFYAFLANSDSTKNSAFIGGSSSLGNSATEVRFFTAENTTTTVGTERMRIDSSGNVLVGTTVTSGVIGTSSGFTAYPTGAISSVVNDNSSLFSRKNSNGNVIRFRRDITNVGTISVTTTSTSYNTSSDYRLKENITEITDGITRVKQLNPYRFNFIADPDNTVDGFIAHEVSDVVPEAVHGEKDALNEDETIDPQSIDQSKLIPLLTAALQEALVKIEQLETRMTELENK